MPIYEYQSEQDGTIVELMRPMADADKPVSDPDGKARTFRRVMSTFAAQGTGTKGKGAGASLPMGGCCPCGKNAGSCSRA